jgi:hypothetical protein
MASPPESRIFAVQFSTLNPSGFNEKILFFFCGID